NFRNPLKKSDFLTRSTTDFRNDKYYPVYSHYELKSVNPSIRLFLKSVVLIDSNKGKFNAQPI
ncbi:hypothetical protein QUF54_11370, partial [Candidatus Marithioploca araucensis]|nr:hypothetical protein [Candidatus Marithioploca araucensis]